MTQPCQQELKFVSLIVVAAIALIAVVQFAAHYARNTTTSKPLSTVAETWNPTFNCYVTNATGERLHLTCVRSPVFKSANNGARE